MIRESTFLVTVAGDVFEAQKFYTLVMFLITLLIYLPIGTVWPHMKLLSAVLQ